MHLLHVRKNNALANDSDTLQDLLFVAIQGDDFELSAISFVLKPDSTVDNISTEICKRKMSLMMKDRTCIVSVSKIWLILWFQRVVFFRNDIDTTGVFVLEFSRIQWSLNCT
jgi:hypothetical protein